METLIINNNTNILDRIIQNNEIRLDFTMPVTLKNKKIALSYLGIYYSWRNITAAYNNNLFGYTWNGTTYNVPLPDGFYSINDISTFMQLKMFENNHYVLDSNANPIYFIRFSSNATYYCTTVDCFPIQVPVGGSNPNAITNQILNSVPQLVLFNNALTATLGILAGSYPSTSNTTTIYSFNSQLVPAIVNVTSVYVACNMVNNRVNRYRNVMYQFAPAGGNTYGSYLVKEPYQPTYYDVEDGSYTELSLMFYDQDYKPIPLLDRNISATVTFQEKKI